MQTKNVKKNVFVIDDDASIGEILKVMLEGENYNVFSFTTGKMALRFYSQEKPDLVILDYFLMGENFTDILNGFKKAGGKNLPIILMSANREAAGILEKNAVREFVEKPFQRETMLKVIARNIN